MAPTFTDSKVSGRAYQAYTSYAAHTYILARHMQQHREGSPQYSVQHNTAHTTARGVAALLLSESLAGAFIFRAAGGDVDSKMTPLPAEQSTASSVSTVLERISVAYYHTYVLLSYQRYQRYSS